MKLIWLGQRASSTAKELWDFGKIMAAALVSVESGCLLLSRRNRENRWTTLYLYVEEKLMGLTSNNLVQGACT